MGPKMGFDWKDILIFLFSVVIIVSFFLPWLEVEKKGVDLKVVRIGKREVSLRGCELIKIVDGKKVKPVIGSEPRLFGKKVKIKNSYLIYAIPISALFCLLLTFLSHYRRVFHYSSAFLLMVIGIGIFGSGLYIIFGMAGSGKIRRLEEGIWFSLFSFLGIGLCGFMKLISKSKSLQE